MYIYMYTYTNTKTKADFGTSLLSRHRRNSEQLSVKKMLC